MRAGNITKKIVIMGLLIAIEIVLSRLLSIPTKITKISLGFIPIAIAAMAYGPLWAGTAAALADFIGALVFPTGGYFFGFTVTAFLRGFLFGLFLYERGGILKGNLFIKSFLAAISTGLLLTVGLNTFWLCVFFDNSLSVLVPARLIQVAVMIPIQTILIPLVSKRLTTLARA